MIDKEHKLVLSNSAFYIRPNDSLNTDNYHDKNIISLREDRSGDGLLLIKDDKLEKKVTSCTLKRVPCIYDLFFITVINLYKT